MNSPSAWRMPAWRRSPNGVVGVQREGAGEGLLGLVGLAVDREQVGLLAPRLGVVAVFGDDLIDGAHGHLVLPVALLVPGPLDARIDRLTTPLELLAATARAGGSTGRCSCSALSLGGRRMLSVYDSRKGAGRKAREGEDASLRLHATSRALHPQTGVTAAPHASQQPQVEHVVDRAPRPSAGTSRGGRRIFTWAMLPTVMAGSGFAMSM